MASESKAGLARRTKRATGKKSTQVEQVQTIADRCMDNDRSIADLCLGRKATFIDGLFTKNAIQSSWLKTHQDRIKGFGSDQLDEPKVRVQLLETTWGSMVKRKVDAILEPLVTDAPQGAKADDVLAFLLFFVIYLIFVKHAYGV